MIMNFFHMISVGNSQDGEFDIIIGHLQDIIIGKITCTTHIQTCTHTHTHNVNRTICISQKCPEFTLLAVTLDHYVNPKLV